MTSAPRSWRSAGTLSRRVAPLARGISRMLRAIAGAPDYDRYLAHVRAHHPGEVPLSQREFARQRMHARYDTPGSRCC